jgi:hypothetical protein
MALGHQEIMEISGDVIRRYPQQAVDFIAVIATEGGSDRVELMVTVKARHAQPCNLMLNLPRKSKASFEDEFRRRLEQELHDHTPPHK